ncbi:MAG: histidine kinase, partial [Phototrophicales bacterium]
PLYIKPVNLSHIVQEIVTSLQQQTPDYHHTTFVIQPDLIARCDEGLIRIMLQNLLENAWKFTRERANARIEFGSVPQSHPTVYYIKDNGIGFDPQYADDLFHAFRKLHVGYDGSGIGLATVQRIINRHGGEIWAEASPGKGATFYFKLL